MIGVQDLISGALGALLEDLLNPQKRVFFGYLLVCFPIAAGVLWSRYSGRISPKQLIRIIFAPKIWFSKSSITDLKLVIFNKLLFGGVGMRLLSKSAVGFGVYFFLIEHLGDDLAQFSMVPSSVVPALFTATLFIVDDYSRYWVHRLMHKIPILWEFHKVHHSSVAMTPLTVFRTHPVEAVIFSIRGALVQGTLIGIFFAAFQSDLTLLTIFGANVASVIFHSVGSNLRHSHILLRYPTWCERWVISPAQHQIHHSVDPRHYDKNFGVAFAAWDRLHGSFHYSESARLRFGLSGETSNHFQHTLMSMLLSPFCKLIRSIRHRTHHRQHSTHLGVKKSLMHQ